MSNLHQCASQRLNAVKAICTRSHAPKSVKLELCFQTDVGFASLDLTWRNTQYFDTSVHFLGELVHPCPCTVASVYAWRTVCEVFPTGSMWHLVKLQRFIASSQYSDVFRQLCIRLCVFPHASRLSLPTTYHAPEICFWIWITAQEWFRGRVSSIRTLFNTKLNAFSFFGIECASTLCSIRRMVVLRSPWRAPRRYGLRFTRRSAVQSLAWRVSIHHDWFPRVKIPPWSPTSIM